MLIDVGLRLMYVVHVRWALDWEHGCARCASVVITSADVGVVASGGFLMLLLL